MNISLGLLAFGGCTFPTGGDVTAPVLVSAVIPANGLTLTLTYSEALDTGSTPSAGAFALAGTASTVASVNVTGSTVVLTLNTAALISEAITVSYTPGGSPIQDVAGNDAASLSGQAVTNNSTVGAGTALLVWSEGQFNRQHDASVSPTYQTGAATIAVATEDVARLEDTNDGHGALLLIEGQRAAQVIKARSISTWTPGNSATVSANTENGPEGALTADAVTFAASTISNMGQTITAANIPSSTNLVWMVWAKSGTGSNEKFRFWFTDKSNVVTQSADFTVTTTWQLFVWEVNSGAGAGNAVFRLGNASDAVARGPGRIVVFDCFDVQAYAFPSSIILNEAAAPNNLRRPDVQMFLPEQVPLRLRTGKWATAVRTKWASADLVSGEERWIASFGGSSDGLLFRHNGTDVRLEARVGGSVVAASGPVTATRGGWLPIVVDCAAGVLTVNGVAGSAGSPIVWPAGLTFRWGGIVAGAGEAFASFKVPEAA